MIPQTHGVPGDKKDKIFPAFKVSEAMHGAVTRSAAKAHRKLMDQVRYLIDVGLQRDDRLTTVETEVAVMKETLSTYGPPRSKKRA